MEIKFYGHACFSIKEGNATIVTDPYDESTGLKLPSLSSDVVVVSHNHPNHNNVKAINGEPKIFNWPGEYETQNIYFKGIHSFHNPKDDPEQNENTIFTITFKNIHICHLGDQGTKLTPEQLEKVGEVDILFVPIGSKDTINAKKAKEVVEQIEPRIVIPMVYHTEGSTIGLDTLEPFLAEMGAKNIEPIDCFTVKRSELPEDNSKVVILNSSV